MALYQIKGNCLDRLPDTSLVQEGVQETDDLQLMLRGKIDIVSRDTLVISEEYSRWDDSSRRIDLLGLDHDANLVVIEL